MFRRFYHVSTVLRNVKKQGLKLTKLLNPDNKKRWFPSETIPLPSIKSLTKTKYEPGKRGVRRVAVLNKIFMKYITDIMSTGTVAMNIVGKGIEISKVRVNPDFHTVNVFWVCKGNSTDEETESLLQTAAGTLRHELSTLRVMGEVPYIVFVKDKQEALIADIDRKLSIADYGEDYTPTEMGHLLKTEFSLDTKLSPEMKSVANNFCVRFAAIIPAKLQGKDRPSNISGCRARHRAKHVSHNKTVHTLCYHQTLDMLVTLSRKKNCQCIL